MTLLLQGLYASDESFFVAQISSSSLNEPLSAAAADKARSVIFDGQPGQ